MSDSISLGSLKDAYFEVGDVICFGLPCNLKGKTAAIVNEDRNERTHYFTILIAYLSSNGLDSDVNFPYHTMVSHTGTISKAGTFNEAYVAEAIDEGLVNHPLSQSVVGDRFVWVYRSKLLSSLKLNNFDKYRQMCDIFDQVKTKYKVDKESQGGDLMLYNWWHIVEYSRAYANVNKQDAVLHYVQRFEGVFLKFVVYVMLCKIYYERKASQFRVFCSEFSSQILNDCYSLTSDPDIKAVFDIQFIKDRQITDIKFDRPSKPFFGYDAFPSLAPPHAFGESLVDAIDSRFHIAHFAPEGTLTSAGAGAEDRDSDCTFDGSLESLNSFISPEEQLQLKSQLKEVAESIRSIDDNDFSGDVFSQDKVKEMRDWLALAEALQQYNPHIDLVDTSSNSMEAFTERSAFGGFSFHNPISELAYKYVHGAVCKALEVVTAEKPRIPKLQRPSPSGEQFRDREVKNPTRNIPMISYFSFIAPNDFRHTTTHECVAHNQL